MKYVRFILLIVMSVSILQGCNTAKEKADKAEDKTENVKNAAENKTENAVEDIKQDDRKGTNNTNNENNENTDEYDEEKFKLDNETVPFKFHKFKLKATYENDKEYKAKFEKEEDDYLEAEFKDETNNEELEGKAAYDHIKDKLEKLTFDQHTDKNKVIEEVTKEFDLKPDYKSLKLKVRFENGTEKEYTK